MKKIFIVLIIIIFIVFLICWYQDSQEEVYEDIYIVQNISNQDNKIENIKIHIVGEILNPGMYEIESGSRINDIIEIAGGVTEKADINKINLAYEVSDGEKIYIPSIFDDETEYNINSGEKEKKVNINKANKEELQQVSGIGEALAERIIKYRTENGRFSNIDDLKNVSGIGEKKFENIKDYIVVK